MYEKESDLKEVGYRAKLDSTSAWRVVKYLEEGSVSPVMIFDA